VCWTTPLAVTKAFNAHLTGVTFVQNKPIVGPLFDGATMITVHEYRRELQAAADAAEVRFRNANQLDGLSAESMVLSAERSSVPELLARTARRFDLTILLQAEPEEGGSEEVMIEASLLRSGRPILIVPYFPGV
jgi:hypothetical protein